MVSLLTNTSAMSALRVLSGTENSLNSTENQVSTGLRVSDASDNAAYWAIGVGMRSQVGGISAVQDSLSLTNSIADVTSAALKSIIGAAQDIEKDVVAAAEPGVDLHAVQKSIAAKQDQIMSTIRSASFNGVNWLYDARPISVVENRSYTETTDQTFAANQAEFYTTVAGPDVHVTQAATDSITVTNPQGHVSTFSAVQSQIDSTNVKNIGSIAFHITAVTGVDPTTTENIYQPTIADSGIPVSYGSSGLIETVVDPSSFNLAFNVETSQVSSYSYTFGTDPVDAGTYTSNPSIDTMGSLLGYGPFFAPESGSEFIQKAVPSSPLSYLMGIDVTDDTISPTANQTGITSALNGLISIASKVGSLQNQVANQQSFNSALSDALNSGVGSLVDADMNVASTRLQALQTQQQLGVQALSIANDNSAMILKLFG